MGKTRKSFHFDLDTNKMKQYYDGGKDYRKGYSDIKRFMVKKGFVHEQGSGYTSKKPMTDTEALTVALQLKAAFPWIEKCVKVFTVTDFRKGKNITGLIKSSPFSPEPNKQLTLDSNEFKSATLSMEQIKENVAVAQEIYDKSPKLPTHNKTKNHKNEL